MASAHATTPLQQKLAEKGFDICHVCNVSWYNRTVGSELSLPFDDNLALIVGNSKALWQPLLEHYRRHPVVPNPVDAYTFASIQACLADAGVEACDVFTAQDISPGRLVAFQRLAHVAGLAYYDQESFLCLHPQFGPWFALRALVILPEKSTLLEPELLSDPTPSDVRVRVKEAFEAAVASDDRFLPWVRLRDAVAPSHPCRYSEEQIRYHYLKELDYFKSLLADRARDDPTDDHTEAAAATSSFTVL